MLRMNNTTLTRMNTKYAFVHGGYWMVFGATYNFVTVYLLARNFTSYHIGLILASTNIFSVLLQPLIAGYADRTKKVSLKYIISFMLFICITLSVFMVFAPDIMLITAFLYFLLLTVMLTIHPLINALGINYINRGLPLNFGFARGMGSLSYAIMSFLLGSAVNNRGTGILPYAFIGLFSITFISTNLFKLKEHESDELSDLNNKSTTEQDNDVEQSHLTPVGFMRKYWKFTIYLLGVTLIFICFNIINIYMIKIVENVGGNEASMGSAFAIAAILELPVMLSFSKLIMRYKITTMLKFSALAFTLKAFITLISPNIPMIFLAQAFQMLSYAIFIPGSIYYVNKVLDSRDMIKGQAFTTAATTLGGVGGSLIGGWLLSFTTVSNTLLAGLILSAVGSLILYLSIEKS